MGHRIRRNVYDLPAGDDTLDWYRRAVDALWREPTSRPTSWRFMGAVHGNPGIAQQPGSPGFWDQCQHQTWYFLPWHRAYITAFEAVIARTVSQLGGPAEWALPYWNYSEELWRNPEARFLPPAFRDERLTDGTPNALFASRNVGPGGDVGLRDQDVTLAALNEPEFTPSFSFGSGFGGPRTGFSHFGQSNGELERAPHNAVHGRIGGWMGNPNFAAFDPIFWLHHCNIDRLWQEWLAADQSHANPGDGAWVNGVTFQMYGADDQPFNFTSADMINTTQVLHGFAYDTLPEPILIAALEGGTEMSGIPPLEPELAGSSEAPLKLDGARTSARVVMQEAQTRSFTESTLPTPERTYLRLENVVGKGVPADFDVLVDLEGDSERPMVVGVLATFGIANASDPDAEHGGGGLTQVFDITDAAERLNLTTEAAPLVRVTFERVEQGAVTEATLLPEIDSLPKLETGESSIEVGRIAVYFE